jgi:thiamine kinase-like enzyme
LPQQGFSNENHRFRLDEKTYLFRKFKLADRDRKLEFEIQILAYENALAAKPCTLNLSQGYMICEFLEGEHKEKLEREDIALVVQVLRKLHTLKIAQPPLDLKSQFSTLDKTVEDAFKIIESISAESVLCHNDLNPKNCLFSEKSLKLIDWEFAGMNDRYFDLAAVSVEFQFELSDEACFLASYFGREKWNKEKLEAYKIVYKALCEKWFNENM